MDEVRNANKEATSEHGSRVMHKEVSTMASRMRVRLRRAGFRNVVPAVLVISSHLILAQTKVIERYKDARLPIEQRVSDLMSRMTLEEKVRQLVFPRSLLKRGCMVTTREPYSRCRLD